MRGQIQIDTFSFTKEKPKLEVTDELQLELIHNKVLQIELVEIEWVDNPSDLIIVITTEGIGKVVAPFYIYKHRSELIYQDGRYILPVTNFPEFQIATGGTIVDIEVISENKEQDFKLTMYYRAYPTIEDVK